MSPDISKDPRILMVEHVLKRLKDLTVNKRYKLPASKENTMEAISKLNSAIKTIRYSYTAPLELVDNQVVKEFDLMTNQFWDAILKNYGEIEKNKLMAAELKFIFNILKGFRERLRMGNEISIEKSIDLIAVKIVAVTKLDQNLKLCRVGDGKGIITIITNLSEIKKDMVVPAAILPPREFGAEVSEAMFCSGKDLLEMHDHVGEYVSNLPDTDLKEVKHTIVNLLKDI